MKRELSFTVGLANTVLFCKVSEGSTRSRSCCFRAAINLKGALLDLVDLESGAFSSCFIFVSQSLG